MAHKDQVDFLLKIKKKFPEKFENCSVIDIGSLDINGNNHYLFKEYTYIGIDIGEGNNVDVICRAHEYETENKFDIVISTECLEHDEFYYLTIKKMFELTKSGGLMIITCATEGRPEHGTKRTSPNDAPFVGDYYKNLNIDDIKSHLNTDQFELFEFEINYHHKDLYFYGIKK